MDEGPLAGRTVCITGGAGFVGGHLARALVPRAEVRVFDDLSTGRRAAVPEAATLIRGDVRDSGALDRAFEAVDVVFHQAGVVDVAASVADPRGTHAVNAAGTLEVLEAARRADARVVAASSAAVYGTPEALPVEETESMTPRSPYGVQKLSLDHHVRLYHDRYGLETVALRYFNVYGPGQAASDYANVIEVFLDRARRGEALTVEGDGRQTRDFVHVADVVWANRLAAATDAVGEAYNVGTGESVSILDLARRVRRVVGADVEIVYGPPRPGDVGHSRAAIGKARRLLDYEPQVGLDEGLRSLVDGSRRGPAGSAT